mgnify:CR=1 FL=1
MSKHVPGPAAQLIDFGFAVKQPLCQAVDYALGLQQSAPWSLTGFLDFCYEVRRPGFELLDTLYGFSSVSD